ncbi:MAG: hypothetical protein R8K53_06080 [Mariprofundaceae bacterium]
MARHLMLDVFNRCYLRLKRFVETHHGMISDVAEDGALVLFGTCGKESGLVMDAIKVHSVVFIFTIQRRIMYIM